MTFFQKSSWLFAREKKSKLNQARRDIESVCKKKPVEIFHLQEFVFEDIDDGRSRQLYDKCISDIVRFYETLTPSRKELDFSSPLFAGTYETTSYRTETKIEDIEDSHVETKYETRTVQVPETEVNDDDARLHGAIGGTVVGAGVLTALAVPPLGLAVAAYGALHATFGAIFGSKEEIKYVDAQREFSVNFIVKEKIRRTFKREVKEVWKVLAGGIRIFKDYEYGPWELVSADLMERSVYKD